MRREAKIERSTDALKPHPHAGLVPRMSAATFAAFKTDIAEQGILVPLDITKAGVVLDGVERLRAANELRIGKVEVRIVAPKDQLDYRVRCAIQRRDLSASQRAMIVVEFTAFSDAREEGKRRRQQNLRQATEVAALPPRGRTRALGAEWSGASERSIQDAITVWDNDRELAAQVKNGKLAVDMAARRIRRRTRDASIPPAPPLPAGPFELIYADPPWQLGNPDSAHAPEQHYPTMPTAEIAALAIPSAEDSVLYLWAVSSLLQDALDVIRAWGFAHKTTIVWVKNSIGPGVWARNRHELILVGRKGNQPPPEQPLRPDSVIEAARRKHSQKPEAAYELIERAYPHASKLELFARNPRAGWTAWGNQAPSTKAEQ